MNFAAYIPLAGFFVNIFFAVFVFTRAPRAAANRVYLLLGLSIATWNLGSYFLFIVNNHDDALFWARFLQFGCIFGVVAFFHLALLIAGFKVERWIWWLYGFETVLAATNFTPLFVKDVRLLGSSGWYAMAGPAFHVFNVPFCLMFGSIFVILKRYKSLPQIQRRRLIPMIWAEAMLSVFGANDVLPIVGIEHYPFTHILVYPFGSLAAVFYGLIVAYSVLHHQLLEVRVALSGIVAHAIRFAFLFTIAGGLLLAAASFSGAGTFNATSFSLSMGIFIVSAISASVLFPRLFGGKGIEKLERRILGDQFEYQERVRAFINNMVWHQDLPELLEDLHGVLTGTFRITTYQVIMRDQTHRAFGLIRSHPDESVNPLPELNSSTSVLQYFEWRKAEFLLLRERDPGWRGPSLLETQAREAFSAFSADICFPLSWENETFGLLLVGPKINGDAYTSTDISLLVAIVKNMSLMVNQFRLKTQVLQAQELDLLGKMSRGMAHDLNNLLTPVWTLLQLTSEDGTDQFDEELLPVALRNVKTMRAYIKEALFFSENLRPDLQLGRLDLTVRNAVEVARASRKKEIRIDTSMPDEVLAEMDEVLLQRLIANLIANAIDASPEAGTIRVVLERLPKLEPTREWLRVRVIDHGEGIPKENLSRILTPYFTTKDRGDENRGFGLGLAICRKIVTLHGGNLAISSQIRKGTTVQVDLPSRQLKTPVVAAVVAAS